MFTQCGGNTSKECNYKRLEFDTTNNKKLYK